VFIRGSQRLTYFFSNTDIKLDADLFAARIK